MKLVPHNSLLRLCNIQGLTLDLTKVSDDIKKEIVEVKYRWIC